MRERKRERNEENWKHRVELVSTCHSYVKWPRNLIVNETNQEFWKSGGYRWYRPTGRASKERISGSLSYYESIRSYETASRDGIRESPWFRDASVATSCCILKGWFKGLPSYHLLPLKDSNINSFCFRSSR